MRELKFSCAIELCGPQETIRQGLLAEKYGFDSIWVPDHFLATQPTTVCPEAWSVLAAIGFKTNRAMLSTGVTDPLRRHPATITQAVATLDNLLGGRMMLGIGVGEYVNLVPFGIEGACIQRLKEAVECIKLLWTATPENPTNYNGEFYQFKDAFLTVEPRQKPHPPIYIGALGPRTRELVGELADGWYPWISAPELYQEDLKDVERGVKRAGRSLDEIDAAVSFYTAVSDDYDEARSAIEWISKRALVLERRTLKRLGHGVHIPKNLSIQRSLSSKEVASAVRDLARTVPMKAVEAISGFGTVEDCINKIEEFLKVGARHLIVHNVGPNIDETLRRYGEEIMPYFKEEQKLRVQS